MQSTLNEPDTDAAWQQLAPLLDDALNQLGETDRAALVLRYFENKTAREIAEALRMEEEAAQKRVARALEKLRAIFAKRGVTLTPTDIAGTVAANSVQAAPAGLAVAVTAAAKGTAVGGSTLTLVKGALKIMAWTKAKTAIIAGAVVLLAAGTTTVAVNEIHPLVSRDTSWTNDPKNWQIDFNNPDATISRISRFPPAFVLRPTQFRGGYGMVSVGSKMIGKNQPAAALIQITYDQGFNHRLVMPKGFVTKFYDILITLPSREHPYEKLQRELAHQLGLTAHFETNEVDVLFLTQATTNAPGLVRATGGAPDSHLDRKSGSLVLNKVPLSFFAGTFDTILHTPVIDQTRIVGDYNCTLRWSQRPGESVDDAFKRAVSEQLGLEFVPGRKSIPMLVVERVK